MSNHCSAAMPKFPGDDPRLDGRGRYGRSCSSIRGLTARLRDERLIADLTVVEIADGPHAVGWTHPEEVNSVPLPLIKGVFVGVGGRLPAGVICDTFLVR
jgi:hypothetical protein